jgi:hypothetical protein
MISKREAEDMRKSDDYQEQVTKAAGVSIKDFSGVPVWVTDRAKFYREIDLERQKQDAKWGVQDHEDVVWHTILAEEVGEAAQEVLQCQFGDLAKGHGDLREELIHIAAVAVAWIESVDRGNR